MNYHGSSLNKETKKLEKNEVGIAVLQHEHLRLVTA
jgi:hypothetical protein